MSIVFESPALEIKKTLSILPLIIYNIKNEILFPCSEIISLNVYILFTDFNNSGKFTPFYHFAWGHNIADNVGVLVG